MTSPWLVAKASGTGRVGEAYKLNDKLASSRLESESELESESVVSSPVRYTAPMLPLVNIHEKQTENDYNL